MKKNLMLIINPAAGRGGYKQGFTEALRALDDGDYRTTLFYTSASGEATRTSSARIGDCGAWSHTALP